jgi:hypothetical protein
MVFHLANEMAQPQGPERAAIAGAASIGSVWEEGDTMRKGRLFVHSDILGELSKELQE